MKQPTKKPKEIESTSYMLETWSENTPEDFRVIADQMEAEGVSTITIMLNDDSIDIIQHKLETDIEAEVRYTKEFKKYQTWKKKEAKAKDNRRMRLIKEAKKLGLKIEDCNDN